MKKTTKERTQTKSKTKRKKTKPKKTPRTRKPVDMSLDDWQIALRREFGRGQNFKLKNIGDEPIFSEFLLTNPDTERTYRVAIRGNRLRENYCSCPDFAVNTLGTCKHIEFTLAKLERKRGGKKAFKEGFQAPYSEVYLRYGAKREVRFKPGTDCPDELISYASKFFDRTGSLKPNGYIRFHTFLKNAPCNGHDLRCYEDTLQFIAQIRDGEDRKKRIDKKFPQGESSRPFRSLLKTDLYPYQRKGALFAAKEGRVLIGDDMGLGKTIQAIAAVEILTQTVGIERVLIISPTSLKHQWKQEIERFTTGRSIEVVEGLLPKRKALYRTDTFYKIINYDVIHRDADLIDRWEPDVIILDEAQRIKNWKTRRAQSVKRLQSQYAIVLTGTPLENRLEELHSIVEFLDVYRLGPLFRYLGEHQITDEVGKVVGYKNLSSIAKTLEPILIRRTKKEVLKDLPERVDKHFFLPMTEQQQECHKENQDIVARVVHKWRQYGFLSEQDQRRLMIAMQNMRMACNSTYLLDKSTDYGVKADEFIQLMDDLLEEPDTKVVVFSQWIGTHQLIIDRLESDKWNHIFFHGAVPSPKRRKLIQQFKDDPESRIFLSTDAGGVGLNLQIASVIVNMDQPWNPAVLEQRIGRVHRLGQKRNVRVFHFVSQGTIEHGMLDVLAFKQSVFAGVLDGGEDEVFLGGTKLKKFMETVDRVTDNIPGSMPAHEEPPTAADESIKEETLASEKEKTPRQPSGQPQEVWNDLISTGLDFIGKLGQAMQQPESESPAKQFIGKDEKTGETYLKLPMPDQDTLNQVSEAVKPLLNLLRKQ